VAGRIKRLIGETAGEKRAARKSARERCKAEAKRLRSWVPEERKRVAGLIVQLRAEGQQAIERLRAQIEERIKHVRDKLAEDIRGARARAKVGECVDMEAGPLVRRFGPRPPPELAAARRGARVLELGSRPPPRRSSHPPAKRSSRPPAKHPANRVIVGSKVYPCDTQRDAATLAKRLVTEGGPNGYANGGGIAIVESHEAHGKYHTSFAYRWDPKKGAARWVGSQEELARLARGERPWLSSAPPPRKSSRPPAKRKRSTYYDTTPPSRRSSAPPPPKKKSQPPAVGGRRSSAPAPGARYQGLLGGGLSADPTWQSIELVGFRGKEAEVRWGPGQPSFWLRRDQVREAPRSVPPARRSSIPPPHPDDAFSAGDGEANAFAFHETSSRADFVRTFAQSDAQLAKALRLRTPQAIAGARGFAASVDKPADLPRGWGQAQGARAPAAAPTRLARVRRSSTSTALKRRMQAQAAFNAYASRVLAPRERGEAWDKLPEYARGWWEQVADAKPKDARAAFAAFNRASGGGDRWDEIAPHAQAAYGLAADALIKANKRPRRRAS
jgi:hypothetical protein